MTDVRSVLVFVVFLKTSTFVHKLNDIDEPKRYILLAPGGGNAT